MTPQASKSNVSESSNGQPPRPAALPVIAENMPQVLRDLPRWVLWRYDLVAGDWRKVPYHPRGHKASSTDATTWSSYAAVLAAYQAGGWDGIGVVLGTIEGGGLTLAGVDYDDCLDEAGRLTELAARGVRSLNTYAEVSPSGTGIKLLCWGTLKANHGHKDGHPAEAYHGGRYFCLTGHILPGVPCEIADRATELRELDEELWSEWTYTGAGRRDDREIAREALAHLGTSRAAGYGDWLAAGMALHSVGDDLLPDWDSWSRSCPEKYQPGACAAKWPTFSRGGGLTLGSLIHWAKQDSNWTPSAGGEGGEGPGHGGGGAQGKETGRAIILAWLRQEYDPAFRRDEHTIFSRTRGQLVKRAEACYAPSEALVQQLVDCASDLAGGTKKVRRRNVPKHFGQWVAVAWRGLVAGLPDEDQVEEIEEGAQHTFAARIRAGLLTRVNMRVQSPGQEESEPEARSLLNWCRHFAKTSGWTQVRDFLLWARWEKGHVRAALRPELFGQVHMRDVGEMPYRKFAALCKCYGVGRSVPIRAPGWEKEIVRMVVLHDDFLSDLTAPPPADPPADPPAGDEGYYGVTEGPSRAHARGSVTAQQNPFPREEGQ
jgi:hypothetical protein